MSGTSGVSESRTQFETRLVPEGYDTGLGPVFFKPHAKHFASMLPSNSEAVLELAAGTGILTAALLDSLESPNVIVTTDINEGMLQRLRAKVGKRTETVIADACCLPFLEQSFDSVACQFGVMFFKERQKAFIEAHRVLRPGGTFLFNVWDSLESHAYVSLAVKTIEQVVFQPVPSFYMAPFVRPTVEQMYRELQTAEFDFIEFESAEIDCPCEDPAQLAKGLVSLNPIAQVLKKLGPATVNAVESKVKDGIDRMNDRRTRAITCRAAKAGTPTSQ